MYLPRQFQAEDWALAQRLMREHPLATLVNIDDQGFPFASHLPLKLELCEPNGQPSLLLGHLARANPQAAHLAQRPEALVIFLGPHAFMSTRVYPDLQRVPTWNYLSVQARVRIRLLSGEKAKDAMLKQLIGEHDPPYADQWRGLPEKYTHGMLSAIVAFELQVIDIQTKIKLNQHRPESHAAMHAAYASGNPRERELAQWMSELGMAGNAK
ncbi:MAG: FMN-binding negative transcriptional regulator [Alphaproteobacteria bacterium]|nr:FMN-binding negative transcriptional regulator [Alphaproteobacteria bacterium]